MIPRVKICGITSVEDALAAVDAGASALGFMFYEPSPRNLTPEEAEKIIRELPPLVARVGVFVDAKRELIDAAVGAGIDTLQFHGKEPAEFCRDFSQNVIKAFRIKDESSLNELAWYDQETWLLDSYVKGVPGGTGACFNWDLAKEATSGSNRVLLAGGLTVENVGEAVRQVRPYGVDVSSGVEASPGKKDRKLVAQFIREAVRSGLE